MRGYRRFLVALPLAMAILTMSGCTSVGSVGLMVRSTANPIELTHAGKFQDLGMVEASDCRYLIIGILPLGNADPGHVLEEALRKSGADALLNVSTANSHYGFVPIYNVFSITCTSLNGTAIKFESASAPAS